MTLGVVRRDLGEIQFITRRNLIYNWEEASAPGSKAASFHTFPTLQGKDEVGILNYRSHALRTICCMREKADVGGVGGATCLHWYSLHFN